MAAGTRLARPVGGAPARTPERPLRPPTHQELNDLQWVRGEIWANLWHDDRLAVIEPRDGSVRCFVDLRRLLSSEQRRRLGGPSQEASEAARRVMWDREASTLPRAHRSGRAPLPRPPQHTRGATRLPLAARA